MKLTKKQIQKEFNKYPEIVRTFTDIEVGFFLGECTYDGWRARVQSSQFEYSFKHEMGHAMAQILGIWKELGQLVNENQSNSTTNENPFCYGAQQNKKYGYGSNNALHEFSADALAYYYMGKHENLPATVIEFIENEIRKAAE